MNTQDKRGRIKEKKEGIEAIERQRYEDRDARIHGNIEQRGNREERMIIEGKKEKRIVERYPEI